MGFLSGKRLLITGVLYNRSIAYGIARACHREGAELAFSYQGERFKDRIAEFAAEFGSKLIFDCDVGDDAQIERLFDQLGEAWDGFDGFVHAIALRAARGDRRRLPRRPDPRELSRRARHLGLQLPGDGQGGTAAPAHRVGAC